MPNPPETVPPRARAGGGADLSVIIPARNEVREIRGTLVAALAARVRIFRQSVEIILVDNRSADRTAEIARQYADVAVVSCERLRAPCARNHGARLATGSVLVFVDADTRIPLEGLERAWALAKRYEVGIFRLAGDGSGWKSRLWWRFWNEVRRLPLSHAKALPAFMFCTREAFDRYGPFDESVVIGEEWPLTAGCYRRDPDRFVYDRTTCAVTSDRRLTRQRCGYSRTFLKYVWAILHRSGRLRYSDRIR